MCARVGRVAVRTGRYVSLAVLATVYAILVFVWVAANLLPRGPVFGFALTVPALIYLLVLARLATRIVRVGTSPGPWDNRVARVSGPLYEYMTTVIGLTLLGGLVAVFALVVWGASHSVG